MTAFTHITVRVELLNDAGESRIEYGTGGDVDVAVATAVAAAVAATGDESWTMDDWSAS